MRSPDNRRSTGNQQSLADDLATSAEIAVLGGILLDPDSLSDASVLAPEDFLNPHHRDVFRSMQALEQSQTAIDEVSVAQELRRFGSQIPVSELALLSERTPSAANVSHWASVVHAASINRQAHSVALGIEAKAGGAIASVESATEKLLALVGKADHGSLSLDASYAEFRSDQDARWNKIGGYVPTGIGDLDGMLGGGLFCGELITVGARPSVGKTAFALDVARRISGQRKRVLIFSLEMQHRDLWRRLLALESSIDLEWLRNGRLLRNEEQSRLELAMTELRKLPLFINASKALTALRMRAHARAFKAKHGLDVIMVDYLQLVAPADARAVREQQVAEIARTLKIMAEECNVPVVAFAQLNRAIDRQNGAPTFADLRESGAIEQCSDVVAFLWRERDQNNHMSTDRIITIAKNRNGRAGSEADMSFVGAFGKFVFKGERRPA